MTRWEVGDPEPEGHISLRGRSGRCWWRILGGWRHADMSAWHAIPWARALNEDGPFREIRLVGTKWVLADEIEPPAVELTLAPRGPGSRAEILAYVTEVLRQRTTPNPDTSAERLAQGIVTSVLHRLGAGFSVACGGVPPSPEELREAIGDFGEVAGQ